MGGEGFLSDQFKGILYGLGVADFAMPIGFILWSLILILNLKKIDLSDVYTMAMYIIFCCTSGVILCLALPSKYLDFEGLKYDFIFVMTFAMVASLVWNNRRKKQGSATKALFNRRIKHFNDN